MNEAAEYLKENGNCMNGSTYWYGCSSCDAISDSDFYTGLEMGEHSFSGTPVKGGAEGHHLSCLICGESDITVPHVPNIPAATETEAQICTECAYIIAPALNHTEHTPGTVYTYDGTLHWLTCTGCETEKFTEEAHSYGFPCDSTCNVCGAVRVVGHTYGADVFKDYTGHWNECECGERANFVPHSDGGGDGRCDICEQSFTAANDPSAVLKSELKKMFSDTDMPSGAVWTLIITLAGGAAVIAVTAILSKILTRRSSESDD